MNHGQFLIQMTHKSKHNNAGFSWPVPGNPRRGKISTETSLENEDLKFSVSNGVDLILDHNFDSFFGVKTTEEVKMTQIYRLKFRLVTERKRTTRNRGAERTSLSTAKATPSAKNSQATATTNMAKRQRIITLQTKPMKRENTDCRRVKNMPPLEFATKAMRRGNA